MKSYIYDCLDANLSMQYERLMSGASRKVKTKFKERLEYVKQLGHESLEFTPYGKIKAAFLFTLIDFTRRGQAWEIRPYTEKGYTIATAALMKFLKTDDAKITACDVNLAYLSIVYYGTELSGIIRDADTMELLQEVASKAKRIFSKKETGSIGYKAWERLFQMAQAFESMSRALKKGYTVPRFYVLKDSEDIYDAAAKSYAQFFKPSIMEELSACETHLMTSKRCNVSCRICKYDCGPRGGIRTFGELRMICNQLSKFGPVRIIAEASGEPTHPDNLDLITKLKQKVDSRQIRVVTTKMVTNGLLIADDPNILNRLYDVGTRDLGFSIYCNRKTHDYVVAKKGAYDKLFEGLDVLDEHNAKSRKKINKYIEVILQDGITRDDMEEMFNEIPNVTAYQVVPLVPSGRLTRKWEKYRLSPKKLSELHFYLQEKRKELTKRGIRLIVLNMGPTFLGQGIYRRLANRGGYCNAAKNRCFIDTISGEVYACAFFAGFPGMCMGNIFEPDKGFNKVGENFRKLWADEKDRKYLSRRALNFIQDTPPSGLCTNCQHSYVCKGGCLTMAYSYNDVPESDPIGKLAKAREQTICRYGFSKS